MFAAKTTVQLPDGSVAQEHNRRIMFLRANRPQSFFGKRAPLFRVNPSPALPVDNFDHLKMVDLMEIVDRMDYL